MRRCINRTESHDGEFDAGLARPRTKHGLAVGVVGIVLFAAGWVLGRRS